MVISLLTKIKILDNSGALEAKCVRPNKGLIGTSIKIVVTRIRPNSKVRLGKVINAYVVWTKAQKGAVNGAILLRPDGSVWGTSLRKPLPSHMSYKIMLWPLGPQWI